MVSMAVASMATCLVDYGLPEVTSHLSLNEGPKHGVQARTGAGLAVQPRAPAAAEGALPRPRRVRLRLAPVARLMQPVAPQYAVRSARSRLVRVRRTYCSALSGQATLCLRYVRYAGGRYAYPVRTARLRHSVVLHVRTACQRGQCYGVGEAEGLGHQLGERVASSVVVELARLSQRLGWRRRLLHAGFEGPRRAQLAARSVCAPGAFLLRVSGRGVARRRDRRVHRWLHATVLLSLVFTCRRGLEQDR